MDFRLGSEFSVFEHSRHPFIDPRDRTAIQELMRTIMVPAGEPFILQPHEFALAITEETLELDDDVLGRLEGRSSLGRIGIIVHGTAGLFDPGWIGKATLERRTVAVADARLDPTLPQDGPISRLGIPIMREGEAAADAGHVVSKVLSSFQGRFGVALRRPAENPAFCGDGDFGF